MPFTFAHPAVVVPLARYSPKYFSVTGLVIGSMAPDFEYFIRMRVLSRYSHSWTGMFWFDLPIVLVLAFLFHGIVRNPLIANLPAVLQRRFVVFMDFNWPSFFRHHFPVIIFSALTGIASHILWDGVTHRNGYFAGMLPALKYVCCVGSFKIPLYRILQHVSTLSGGILIAISIRHLPETKCVVVKSSSRFQITGFLFFAGVSLFVSLTRLFFYCEPVDRGELVVTGIASAMAGLFIASLVSPAKAIEIR